MRKPTVALAVFLMLAIPFQGFAAAVMQSSCALGHHRTNGATESLSQAPRHDHAAMNGHAAMHAAATQADASDNSESGSTLECNCGACGLGTALPASKTDRPVVLPHAAPLGHFIDLQIIMITGGPERPPRNTLA